MIDEASMACEDGGMACDSLKTWMLPHWFESVDIVFSALYDLIIYDHLSCIKGKDMRTKFPKLVSNNSEEDPEYPFSKELMKSVVEQLLESDKQVSIAKEYR